MEPFPPLSAASMFASPELIVGMKAVSPVFSRPYWFGKVARATR